jgi:putative ATP-dependent endonuclease of OLD family
VPKAKEPEPAFQELALESSRLKKLIVRNFRCIGNVPVEIELNDIVVLVGPNNAGKSTILRAYEVVMNHGSKAGELTLEDFPGEKVDPQALPEIELQTYVKDDRPAEHWLHEDEETKQKFVRERWIWNGPGAPKRQGHRANANDWDEHVPWGAPNIAKVRRPQPQRIDAFASPKEQADKIIELLKKALLEKAKQAKDDGASVSAYTKLKSYIAEVQKEVLGETQTTISDIEAQLSNLITEVFAGFSVSFEAKPEEIGDKALNLFATNPLLRMGPADGHMAPIDQQGSGARRTLMWAALKLLGEQAPSPKPAKGTAKKPISDTADSVDNPRPNVLLIDEPEICLHPNAIREACRVLYDLAKPGNNWQVMVTTHSPVFIDLARDNTTIVRVERTASGAIEGTTVFRPDRVKLDDNDKYNLKLLNTWDPYVGEFFFGGRTILVEGDTEYSVFRWLIDEDPSAFRDVHVVRARGKGILIPLIKILNHFGLASYAILHDSDRPTTATGEKNSAWGTNESILNAVNTCPDPSRVRLTAAVPDFEGALFGTSSSSDKPYKAVLALKGDAILKDKARQLLEALLDHSKSLPSGIVHWKELVGLEKALKN